MNSNSLTRRRAYKSRTKKSLCRGKRVSNPNKCKKITHCKIARGKNRTFCRKKKSVRFRR